MLERFAAGEPRLGRSLALPEGSLRVMRGRIAAGEPRLGRSLALPIVGVGVGVVVEEGAGFGLGVVAAVGLEAAEFGQGAVEHALEALFGGEEAFEGGVGAGAEVGAVGVVEGGAEGAGDEEAGAEGLGRELERRGEGREGRVVVVEVVVFFAEFFE
jgi:hypothetical protein